MKRSRQARRRGFSAVAFAASLLLAGCKIVSIDADRAARRDAGGGFDARAYVDRAWASRVLPQVDRSAIPISDLDAALAGGLDAAGAAHGRKAAEGSPWTFVVRGEGIVTAIDRHSRSGTIDLAVADGSGSRRITVQTGPVVVNTALRDSLPFVSFNNFSDQIAFAEVGGALVKHALADTRTTLSTVVIGDRLAFVGACNLSAADSPIMIVPVRLQREGAHA